jgi:NAD(P)-dependent dehydrogenase (short-subunit alcohol dehydrogenase family)
MVDGPTLTSARVLVVGASAGIGRSFARHALALGAHVCVSARREKLLVELCRQAGSGHPIAGDITVSEDCRRIVAEAAGYLGGLDLVVCAAGYGTLAPIAAADPDVWRRTYEVNVIGPTLICGAALPLLSTDGLMSFVSSEASTETRWGLSAYAASKAALDAAIRFWRHEHPERRFQRVIMGATHPTEFGQGFDHDVLGIAFERWVASGISMTMMEADEVGRHLAEVLGVILAHPGVDVPDICLDPRGQPW